MTLKLGMQQIQHFQTSFFLETGGRIEAKFHVGPPWDRVTKVYSNGPEPCQYMVKALKVFFSRTKRPMTFKHGMLHRVLEYYQIQMMTLGCP